MEAHGIIDLAIRANSLARTFGFVPEHMSVDTDDIRQEIIVSGTDSLGKVYELQFSVTDTAKLMP